MGPISEAARHDLYNGLSDLLGPDRADTLMAYLPEFDPNDVATKADIAELRVATKADFGELRGDIGDLKSGLAAVNSRLDRLFLTLVAGFFVVVAAMARVVFTSL